MAIVQELQEQGICPTCYNFKYGSVYPDFSDRLIYEDSVLYCFLESRPRALGHTIILVKNHYDDLSYLPDDLNAHVFKMAQRLMKALKNTLEAEKVYLCTMCDGKINHFHVQLIPRFANETIGSTHFVNKRQKYVPNEQVLKSLRKMMREQEKPHI